jgi:hypothetical protein
LVVVKRAEKTRPNADAAQKIFINRIKRNQEAKSHRKRLFIVNIGPSN